MSAIQIILAIIIALVGYPIGLFIARATREELKPGRRWFKLIMLACVLAIIVFIILIRTQQLFFLISVLVFLFLLALASLIESRKKKKK